MTAPTVSVCVPTYNRAGFLRECLASILGQTFTDFELVVVDNASTDETPDLVRGLRDPRLRYERNPENLGQIRNLNRCVELARGDLVCIFHDDDVYDPRILERQQAVFARHPRVGLVHTAVWLLTEDGRVHKLHRVARRDYVRPGVEAFVAYLREAHDIVFSTVMVRRQCYGEAGPFEPRFHCADFDMWLRIALRWDVAYLADPLAGYRIHANTVSQALRAVEWPRENFEIFDRAAALARQAIPGFVELEPEIRRASARTQARRSRIEAAARIVIGDYATAREYLAVSRRLDPTAAGRLAAAALGALRNRPGGLLLRGVGAARYRLGAALNGGEPTRGRRYADLVGADGARLSTA
jgi:glycosyltransferase involved in cell wall biosynthesis